MSRCGGATLFFWVGFIMAARTSAVDSITGIASPFGAALPPPRASTVERSVVAGVDVVVRRPLVASTGVLIVLHGCSHGGYDWATPTECKGCVGLPEELAIARHAVSVDLTVIAPTSDDRESMCWRPAVDGPRLTKVVEHYRRKYESYLPLYVFGVSSGGSMAFMLPGFVHSISAIVVQVMALQDRGLTQLLKSVGPENFPATLLLHMERDTRTSVAVTANRRILDNANVPVRALTLRPAKVTAAYLVGKLAVSAVTANAIVARLTAGRYLKQSGELVEDPRRCDWRSVLVGLDYLKHDGLIADASPLSEVLNVAWAVHEIFSDTNAVLFDWLAKHRKLRES
eukprot:m.411962 g.411962  ORF g.411962 m.411962 type:complete len:342 (+) comp28766_c0_seq1:3482-4507(+)